MGTRLENRWPLQQTITLRNKWGKVSRKELETLTGQSWDRCRRKASAIGLSMPPQYSTPRTGRPRGITGHWAPDKQLVRLPP